MPFLPTLSDLKAVTIAINPLNLFTDSPRSPDTPTSRRIDADDEYEYERGDGRDGRRESRDGAEAGPGPSSLSNRKQQQSQHHQELLNGRPMRPCINTSQSSAESLDSQGERKVSGQGVVIREDDGRPRRDKAKKKVPMESYIIVKPPPTASKNPLNLQIQLVVTNKGRNRSGSDATGTNISTRSPSLYSMGPVAGASTPNTPSRSANPLPGDNQIDLTHSSEALAKKRSDSPGQLSSNDEQVLEPLRRIGSRKSSSSTVNSTAAGSTANAKRIQPMFNLKFHSVVNPTVVTDAGTDAKVAKFSKRCIDIVDVGILEPSEIWQAGGTMSNHVPSLLEASQSRPTSMYSLTAPISPAVTREEQNWIRSSFEHKGLRPDIIMPEGGAKKLFGKIGGAFKKKGNNQDLANKENKVPSASADGASPTPSNGAFPTSTNMMRGGSREGDVGQILGQPTFGCSPLVIARRSSTSPIDNLAPPSMEALVPTPFGSKPLKYVWTVRKWARKNTDSWASHLVAASASGVTMRGTLFGEGDDQVVFEWVKMKGGAGAVVSGLPRSRRSSTVGGASVTRTRSNLAPNDSPTESRGSPSLLPITQSPISLLAHNTSASSNLEGRPVPPRRVSASAASVKTANTNTSASHSPHRAETPTTLTAPDDASQISQLCEDDESDPEDSETPWQCYLAIKKTGERQLLGTLTPAPHHPKVVAQLKLPVRIESLCLADLAGEEGVRRKAEREVSLREEGIKDVVCVTALWLIAREGWGGLRKRKKGN